MVIVVLLLSHQMVVDTTLVHYLQSLLTYDLSSGIAVYAVVVLTSTGLPGRLCVIGAM